MLIEGETGVGKETGRPRHPGVVATVPASPSSPSIAVPCPPIWLNLRCSATSRAPSPAPVADQVGKFQEAHGGTLFLDEVGELPPDAQVKLLRAIQEGEIEPVGAAKPVKVNVRLISATNRRLLNMAKAGAFREDLYYRLNVFPIYVPPLRDRIEDIAPLVDHFIARFGAEAGRHVTAIAPEALERLTSYSWPGNIRQLENAVYRAVVLTETSTLQPHDFPQILAHLSGPEDLRQQSAALPTPGAPIHIDDAEIPVAPPPPPASGERRQRFLDETGALQALADVERDLILFAIAHHKGHMSKVAKSLGIGRSTLYRKLKEYGLADADGEMAA